ncbi:Mce protein [Mycolicibacter sinensis]|uniref:Mce protein n=1 Tax=Mycolicibacter sinensis (strain JDM601) TaxID=875328 RepID=A0A1A3U411_MYCSD|nr:Mce protein [Mycolicibacter sinensis]OBK89624.1 Mce protein [Mycolicibacter sinensis]
MSEETDSADDHVEVEVEAEDEAVIETATDETATDETATGETAPVDADAGPSSTRRRWIAVALLALGVVGAAYEGWVLFAHHEREVAAAQALDAAQKYTTVLTGVDPAAIDKNFAEVLDGATGEFKDMYAASSEQLRQLLIDNKAAAHGTVIEAAVKSAAKNQVEVLLFVDQSVSNKASPQARIDRSRIVMTMEKVNGRWLAAKVDMP